MKNINCIKKYEGRIRQSVVLLLLSLVISGVGGFLFIILLLKNSKRDLLAFGPLFIFLIILGILEFLDFLIFRIWFDEEKIMVQNLFGFRKIYYWSQMIGFSDKISVLKLFLKMEKYVWMILFVTEKCLFGMQKECIFYIMGEKRFTGCILPTGEGLLWRNF